MSLQLPPTATNMPEWVRRVAQAVNGLLSSRGFPFPPVDSLPTDPKPGQAVFDNSDGKAKIWDGAAWQALW